MYEEINYEANEGIAIITIDRQDASNAFTSTTLGELNDALRRTEESNGIYVVLLRGAGEAFCAGADIT